MFSKSFFVFVALALSSEVFGREQWMERNGRAVVLGHITRRRFGQENPPVIQKLAAACPGAVCGGLSGAAITPLLAAQPECTQQDMADQIIDASKQFDAATQANMLALAIEYRQAEKNTPPDFTTNPPTPRNSVFCQKAPKNSQLNGLVQSQDPANGDVFFDPATGASVKRGAQANTAPFGGAAAPQPAAASNSATSAVVDIASDVSTASATDATGATDCVTAVTVTVSADASASTTAAVDVASSSTAAASTAAATGDAGAIGNFGKCTAPQIEFATGFDNRKETSFQPVDKTSFNHGSAQNIDIITQFECDTLVNTCGADQTAKDTCAKAIIAADAAAKGTGAQADAFNAVFGVVTQFADVTQVDNQGNPVAGTGSGAGTVATSAAVASTTAAAATDVAATTSAASSASTTAAATTGSSSAIGNFGKCTVPQIAFAAGFDNRKETSFEPVDLISFPHGSAQGIDIITRAVCDQLVNSCGADQPAKDTCAKAIIAADSKPAKTGAQADAFNAVFGIKTNFSAVQALSDQGVPV